MNTARQLRIFVIGLFFCGVVYGASYPLKVSSTNPRILVDQNNVPFLDGGGFASFLDCESLVV